MQDLQLQARLERVREGETASEKAIQHHTESPDILGRMWDIGRSAMREKHFRRCVRKRPLLVDLMSLRGRGSADGCGVTVREEVTREVWYFVTD